MKMGIVKSEEFDEELKRVSSGSLRSPIIKPPTKIIDIPNPGRSPGDVNVPDSLRKIIGESGIHDRQEALALANNFGISASSASAYANGSNSTASYDEKPNGGFIQSRKDKISKRARGKLMLALNSITLDKLENTKPGEASVVARNMAAIIKDMEPAATPLGIENKSGPTFVFYSPQTKKEEVFDVVFAKE